MSGSKEAGEGNYTDTANMIHYWVNRHNLEKCVLIQTHTHAQRKMKKKKGRKKVKKEKKK